MPSLRKLSQDHFKKYQRTSDIRPARMGLIDGTVEVPNENYMIWVTYLDGTPVKVLNQRIPNRFGKLVIVGFDPVLFPTRRQVLGLWDVYPDAQWAGVGEHASEHGWLGQDPLWISGEQFLPGLVIPVSGSLHVDIFPIAFVGVPSWKLYSTVTRLDVSSSVPTTGARFALLVADLTGAFVLRNGDIAASRNILTEADIPLPEGGDNVLAALVLTAGQTELIKTRTLTDIYDLRFSDAGISPIVSAHGTTHISTGTDPIPNAVPGGTSGLISGADKAKLDSIPSGVTAGITVKELSGISVSDVTTIRVNNGTLTDNSGGQVTIDNSSGGSTGSYVLDPEDCSSQIVTGSETHFSLYTAADSLLVLLNGLVQNPGNVILDIDGLGFTLDCGVSLGDTLIVLRSTSGGTGGGHVIEDNSTPLTQRPTLNFIGATLSDNAVTNATDITITALGGDVVGPSSAVDGNIVLFDTTTGKLIKDSGTAASAFSAIGHTHTGSDGTSKLTQANSHETPDTDSATSSLHHTLGTGSTQAAAGNHTHAESDIVHAQAVFTIESYISALGVRPIRIYIPYVGAGATIEEIYLAVAAAPTVSTLRVNVRKNNTSVFNVTQYAEIAVGAYTASKTTDFASTALAKDDYLTIEVVQANSVAADLSVHVRYKWTITGV